MSFVLQNISYQYADTDKKVLDDISFEIKENEITAIVGPSGCGKSTLVSVLSGIIPNMISTGKLEGNLTFKEELLIAVVSQSPENQLFGYGVEDAIIFGMENMALDPQKIGDNLEYVLNLLNIQHLRKRSIATLSGGQRQAVCIASIIAMEPDIVIMDEPVSSLDPKGKQLIQTTLKQLNVAGQTTIIVDNNINWFAEIFDHIIGIQDGKLLFDGNKDEFFNNFVVQEALGVTVPEEVEIYRELKGKIKDLEPFFNYDGAINELSKHIKKIDNANNSEDKYLGDCILEVKGIHKTFDDDFHALIDVNANFNKGKVVSIIGQNGSGKTTLVKHLNGLLRPTKGDVLFLGNSTKDKSVAQISKDIILVFQHPEHMIFEESVYRELTFCAQAQEIEFDEKEADQVLKEYDLYEDREVLPINLPMGKKHILTILSVLFSSAQVVILDEPTLGMDQNQKIWVEKIIDSLTKKGKTVIMISHEMPLVFKMSDDIVLLNDGIKVFEGTKAQLISSSALFEQVEIPLPSSVKLSMHFNMGNDIFSVKDFSSKFIQQYDNAKENV